MTMQMKICTGFFTWLQYVCCKLKSLCAIRSRNKTDFEDLEDPYISKLVSLKSDDANKK